MSADFTPTDEHIIALYQQRSEEAIEATYRKYGRLLFQLARNILDRDEDAEECVSNACFTAWKRAAEVRPVTFKAWLCRIVRNEAIDRVRRETARKRGAGNMEVVLDELAFCLSSGDDTAKTLERRELASAIGDYLRGQPRKRRNIFIKRYFYMSLTTDIAAEEEMTPEAVRQLLYRMRRELKAHLENEGFGNEK